jgi:hypothetical protein
MCRSPRNITRARFIGVFPRPAVLWNEPIDEPPDPVDLDRHLVAGARQWRVLGHTDREQVPGAQRHELRDLGDQARHVAVQVRGRVLHAELAVDEGTDAERLRCGQRVARDDPGPDRTEAVAALGAERRPEKSGAGEGDVVDDGVARDHLGSAFARHPRRVPSDDYAQRRTDFDRLGVGGQRHRAPVGKPGVARLYIEHRRARRGVVRRTMECRLEQLAHPAKVERGTVDAADRRNVPVELGGVDAPAIDDYRVLRRIDAGLERLRAVAQREQGGDGARRRHGVLEKTFTC